MTIDVTPTVAERWSLARSFQAFRYRDFRLYWLALTVSLVGLAFQTMAQSWLIFQITGSPRALGIAAFIPGVLAAPASIVGGLLADRVSRRSLCLVTQTLMIFPPIILALLVWGGQVQVWHIVASTSALAVITAVDLPARVAMVPQLVEVGDIQNAQAMSSVVRQLSRIIGPALAGLTLATLGEAACFLINGLSYAAMVFALWLMKPQPAVKRERPTQGKRAALMDGVRYILATPVLLGLFIMIAAQGLFLTPYTTFLAQYADEILKIGATGLGWLNVAVGAGALLAALAVANLDKNWRGRVMLIGSLVTPIALGAFALSPWFWLSVPLLVVVGIGTVMITTIAATMLLLIVPDELRGRVNSLGLLIFLGAPQLGSLLVGWAGEAWSTPLALAMTAGLFLVSVLVINLITPQVRHLE
jgi:predicted MFS family arabinose efflux permease